MEELKMAIQAAGEELRDTYEWSLDADDRKPVIETLFAQVVLKHVAPVIAPEAKIAALRAELTALESG
jgi:hypothetical protein